MTIKAIETRYAGCRFRSRLEARWAVFLDTLDWAWEYEAEGFELPSGRYLPDFKILTAAPALQFWLEVKGRGPSEREIRLLTELAVHTSSPAAFVCGDIPRDKDDGWGFGIMPDGRVLPGVPPAVLFAVRSGETLDAALSQAVDLIEPAFIAARSARFEFGERGR